MRKAAFIASGSVLMLVGLVVGLFAAEGVPAIGVRMPLLGWTLFGNPYLDSPFIAMPNFVSALLVGGGLFAVGMGTHLIRAAWARPVALPRPTDWPPHGRVWLALLVAVIGILMFAFGVAEGAYDAVARLVGCIGVLCCAIGWILPYAQSLHRVRAPRVQLVQTGGEQGISVGRFPRQALVFLGIAVPLGLVGAVGTVSMVNWFSGEVVLGSDDEEAGKMLLISPLMLITAVGMLISILRARPWQDRLVLTPTQVLHHTNASQASVPWEKVLTVVDTSQKGTPELGLLVDPDQHVTGRANVALNRALSERGTQSVSVFLQHFAIDPLRLYHLADYYHAHPDSRVELGTDIGIDRIRRADLVPAARALIT